MPRCQFDRRKDELTANLRKLYAQGTDIDHVQGLAWYGDANQIMKEWAGTYRLTIDTVACVTAAISPQCEWKRNLIIADDILAGRSPSIGGALNGNVRKAERLRDTDYKAELGQSISTRMIEVFPQGPKVHSFAQNLSGDLGMVTIDTHATQAALNDPLATYTLKWTPYLVFAVCYQNAAEAEGVSPAIFQAIIWHIWKSKYPRVWKQQNRKQWHTIGEY